MDFKLTPLFYYTFCIGILSTHITQPLYEQNSDKQLSSSFFCPFLLLVNYKVQKDMEILSPYLP